MMEKLNKKKAIVSLSFDDGRKDNYEIVKEILIPNGIACTLNITTGYIDGTCPEEFSPSKKNAMTQEEVIDLFHNPLVEIALHGDKHLNTEEDIDRGRKKVIDWFSLLNDTKFGFASPGSGLKVESFVNSHSELFSEKILYLRTSLRILKFKKIRVFSRKVGRILHLPIFYRFAYKDTIMHHCDDRVIYSVPVLKDVTFEQVKGLVNEAIRQKGTITLMFHSIVENDSGEDNWSWSKEKFENLIDFLKCQKALGNLEVCTTKELYRQIKE